MAQPITVRRRVLKCIAIFFVPVIALTSVAKSPEKNVVLPNPRLIGCKASECPEMLPGKNADSEAVYPWQVSVDFTDGKVIGLTALYDQPTTMADVKEAIDQEYGRWALSSMKTARGGLWRVEPEKFVIQLSTTDGGMIQVVYLIFGARHPMSKQVEDQMFRLYCKSEPGDDCPSQEQPAAKK